ncbi:hypothetical protein BDEG_27199 [Batrachochytrium dendrobatidis JEL423]|uniref:Uncharacterized protein n=1 Tax=Batrachochytrium dendrobatidis (strain JEL423) TaxID=403673 RepID=A0A177WGQ3_BATDL|nr:hypothetical protein BDEG_23169 [Batrachochytrium dendrobatidis JEL423]OAJ43886.1 hypothetical protein BDEG_27199 [Batrachochytrium dendrobatidis JEL423]
MTIGNVRGHLASISNHHIKHISKIDCWTTQLGARVRITVPELLNIGNVKYHK